MARKPRPASKADLNFDYKLKPVDWLDPLLLVKTGIATVISSIFGNYTDKREIQVALNHDCDERDYSAEEELWFDYVADTGDGFDATYTMAYTLAQKELQIEGLEQPLPRGSFLLMGGDQVYPKASRAEYRNRLQGPYQAALPYVKEGEPQPHLYAIPGNHDWYDGLTSFLRIFRKQHNIGDWLTQQSRSYFAIRLPHNWWIWAVDIALDSYIDTPQIEYFKKMAQKMGENDRVILCSAEPSWIHKAAGKEAPWKNLDYIAQIATDKGARVSINLAGDLHHFALYVDKDEQGSSDGYERVKITSGGGGAFLHPTQAIPKKISLLESDNERNYVQDRVYPTTSCSKKLVWRNWCLPFKRIAMSFFIGVFYLTYIWLFGIIDAFHHDILVTNKITSYSEMISHYWNVQLKSPGLLMVNVALVIGLFFYCEYRLAPVRIRDRVLKGIVAFLHAALHILAILSVYTLISHIIIEVNNVWDSIAKLICIAVVGILSGGILGGWVLAIYLIASNRLFGFNYMTAYSSMPVEDYKHFLRIKVQKDALFIYPVVVDKVARKWQFNPQGEYFESWLMPEKSIQTRLLQGGVIKVRR